MNIQTQQSENPTKLTITISGDLSVKFSKSLHFNLKKIKNTYDTYTINLKDISNVDLSGIQIIYSYFNYLSKQNKKIIIENNLDKSLSDLLEKNDMIKAFNSNH